MEETPTTPRAPTPYEPPTVTPVGNLHDLLNGASGEACDATTDQNDNHNPTC